MIRIIVADDHALVIEGVQRMLEGQADITIVSTASDGDEALQAIERVGCDIALLDIDMPKKNGIDVARVLVKDFPKVKIIMLSMHDRIAIVDNLLKIGVHGYLLKTAAKEEVIRAIRKVHEGKLTLGGDIGDRLVERMRRSKGSPFSITKREIQVLELLSKGHSSATIAEHMDIKVHTVNSYRKNLLSKSGTKSAIELVNWARENDLIL